MRALLLTVAILVTGCTTANQICYKNTGICHPVRHCQVTKADGEVADMTVLKEIQCPKGSIEIER